jgi:hypothetical protein
MKMLNHQIDERIGKLRADLNSYEMELKNQLAAIKSDLMR